MSEVVPDSVIEEAIEAVDHPASNAARSIRTDFMRIWLRDAAPVIADWGREQGQIEERRRVRKRVEARHSEREAEMLEADRKAAYKDSPAWAAIRDAKGSATDELRGLLDDELAPCSQESQQ